MNCEHCGAEISRGSNICEYCGSSISAEMIEERNQINKMRCPRCGSTNLSFTRETQGEVIGKKSKAVVHSTVGMCRDCGFTWNASGVSTTKKRKTWLWVLGWIFIFPVPLTIIMLRKKDMKPILKYVIIAVAWLLYIIIGFSGTGDTDVTSDIDDTSADISIIQNAENSDSPLSGNIMFDF